MGRSRRRFHIGAHGGPGHGDREFREWLTTVEHHTRSHLGITLADLPELPLRDGFNLGETPAEFYVGAVLYLAESLGYQELSSSTSAKTSSADKR